LSASPFRVTSFVWEPQPGRYGLTAVAVALAKLGHGREASWIDAASVEPVHDEAQAQALRANLVAPYKPRVDVVVVGHAYAPAGADADRVVVRVRLGDFSKALSVTGDRLWSRETGRWGSSPARPFSQMLLAPERALRSAENPVGLDPAAIPVEGRLALPNLEPAAGAFSTIIGPVPATAPSRRNALSAAGAAGVTALELGHRAGPVPEGFNFAFFNLAPLDQQIGDVPLGSAVVLENLHPREPVFTSRLPAAAPALRAVEAATGRALDLRARCDTVWIDGDREVVLLVFRGTTELLRPDVSLSIDVALEAAPRLAQAPAHAGLLTTQQGGMPAGPTLPFGPSRGVQPPPSWPRHELAQAYAPSASSAVSDEGTHPLSDGSYPPPPPPRERAITAELELPAMKAGLPFQGTRGGDPDTWDTHTQDLTDTPSSPPELPRHETLEVVTTRGTMPPPPASHEVLPFPAPKPIAVTEAAPGSHAFAPESTQDLEPATNKSPARAAKRLLPKGSPGPIPDVGPTLVPVLPPKPEVDDATSPPEPAPDAVRLAVAVPALAPLAVLARPPAEAAPAPSPAPPRAPSAEPPEERAEPEPPPPPPPRETLTLEECAAVRAELSLKGADKAQVLAKHRLSDASWSKLEREHLKAIDEASQTGNLELLDRYDDAYVAAQDALRTPIDEKKYASLRTAREKGRLARALDEAGVSRAELMRLDRVWARRMQADKALGERVDAELERLKDD
jgi:hypothetical protein